MRQYANGFIRPLVANHIRAEHMQIRDGINSNVSDDLNNLENLVVEGTIHSVGPTGSGANTIWTALDNVPDDGRVLILDVVMRFVRFVAASNESVSLFMGSDPLNANERVAQLGEEWNDVGDAGDNATVQTRVLVACDVDQIIYYRWNITGAGAAVNCDIHLQYNGFLA